LRRIEIKLDRRLQSSPSAVTASLPPPSLETTISPALDSVLESFVKEQSEASIANTASPYGSTASAVDILAWPAVQHSLSSLPERPNIISQQEVSSVLLAVQQTHPPLPSQPCVTFDGDALILAPRVDAYLDYFNNTYSVLDRQTFQHGVLGTSMSSGLTEGVETLLTYLVLALGEVALSGMQDVPTLAHSTEQGDARGGTTATPPGLGFFNQARSRIGFHLTENSLMSAQALVLAR
jgi:hypothetical protein